MPREMKWVDATSYSQGCKKRVPSVWEYRGGVFGGTRIVLQRPWRSTESEEPWTARIHGKVSVGTVYLESKEFEAAKAEALALLGKEVEKLLQFIGKSRES